MKASSIEIQQSRISRLTDQIGTIDTTIELIRFDDSWRPLVGSEMSIEDGVERVVTWNDRWGGPHAYGHRPEDRIKPLDFDAWGDPNTHLFVNPIDFEGRLTISPVTSGSVQGHALRVEITDLRAPEHPIDRTLRVPIGIKIPHGGSPRAFGLKEMYLEPELIDRPMDAEGFPDQWFYMEAELFGSVPRHPTDGFGPSRDRWKNRVHTGAPFAAFRNPEDDFWWAVTGEPDYGAAIHWQDDGVVLYTTLYLAPGASTDWQIALWREKEEDPCNVYLTATGEDGFYDRLNPPGFSRKGVPEGPIVFININRPDAYFEELRKVKPKLVILNYFYDHVSCVANMYGTWRTYEGFTMTEEKLKSLISSIKATGAKVGYYGTSVEQPESHKPLIPSDIVMDRWGRSFNAWEPGNWVVDAGNRDCADRLARAEAEFANHYGLDCVFVDRLDHMSVNEHPEREGSRDNYRLSHIPSVRLGVITLNKKRIKWQRKLNPDLYVGLNNTTQWIGGVRYSDFNLLEGGMDLDPPIFFLNAPHGVVHKQHYNVFFCDVNRDVVDHGIIQGEEQLRGFGPKRKAFYRDALADGVRPQPYEDEIFVDPDSQFFSDWNNRDKPDEEKWAFYDDKHFYGGDEWRNDEDFIARAMYVANCHCFPVERIWGKPKELGPGLRFSARKGRPGGYFIGVRNLTDEAVEVDTTIDGLICSGRIEPGATRVWFTEERTVPLETVHL